MQNSESPLKTARLGGPPAGLPPAPLLQNPPQNRHRKLLIVQKLRRLFTGDVRYDVTFAPFRKGVKHYVAAAGSQLEDALPHVDADDSFRWDGDGFKTEPIRVAQSENMIPYADAGVKKRDSFSKKKPNAWDQDHDA